MSKAVKTVIFHIFTAIICLISEHQHGFVKGRSTVTNLLETLDTWTQTIVSGGSIDAIYLDFQKAFDTVPHRRLMMKVKAHGIGTCVSNWVEAFLTDRRQQVCVNGTMSREARVTSGIPQGSVLGPILFVLYINDLPSCVSNYAKLFADDTKIYCQSDVPGASDSLQKDLDNLDDWSDKWQLRFHPDKCSVLKCGKKKSDCTYYMQSTQNDGTRQYVPLSESKAEKDLGVLVDENLSFRNHIAQAVMKANRVVGIIRRSFDTLDELLFTQLFKPWYAQS